MIATGNYRYAKEIILLIRLLEKENKAASQEFIIQKKREVREFLNRKTGAEKIIHSDDAYGYWVELAELPEDITDMETAEEYFNCYMRREYVPSQYDCTGQIFTRWHKVFIRRGRYHVYHGLAMDI